MIDAAAEAKALSAELGLEVNVALSANQTVGGVIFRRNLVQVSYDPKAAVGMVGCGAWYTCSQEAYSRKVMAELIRTAAKEAA